MPLPPIAHPCPSPSAQDGYPSTGVRRCNQSRAADHISLLVRVRWQVRQGLETVQAIAAAIGSSRAAVHRALKLLEQYGLVVSSPRIGPRGLFRQHIWGLKPISLAEQTLRLREREVA